MTVRRSCAVSLVVIASACGGGEQAELQRRQVAAMEQAQLLEAERAAAERLQQERAALVRQYSRAAGQQLMAAVGGGQDLIVQNDQWNFDGPSHEFEIPIDVSFNGSFIRSNNYRVNGILTVGADGTNPRFARRAANENYLNIEDTMTALQVGAAGLLILNDMNKPSQ